MTIQYIDDSDGAPDFEILTGTWNSASGQGRNSTVRFKATESGSGTCVWRFTGLAPDAPHRAMATWSQNANRSVAATYTIHDGDEDGTLLATALVDQTVTASDLTEDGSPWADLSVFVPTGTTAAIVLHNTGPGGQTNIADAVRVSDGDFPAAYVPVLAISVSPPEIRPGHSVDFILSWKYTYPDPAGLHFDFDAPVGSLSAPNGDLGNAGTDTLTVTLSIPFDAAPDDYTFTATPASPYSPLTVGYTVQEVPARIRDGSLMVDSRRNQLRGLAEVTDGGADTTVTAVLNDGSMTLEWDSVSRGPGSIVLDNPLFFHFNTFFCWRLARWYSAYVDDADATKDGAGWSTAGHAGNLSVVGNSRSFTDSDSDTITYLYEGVIPGTYQLETSIIDYDASWASAARYRVYDGEVAPENLVATILFNHAAFNDFLDGFNDIISGVCRLRTIGEFTAEGDTVSVVVDNPDDGGTLPADCLKIVRDLGGDHGAIPEDATNIRLNAPDACITTGSGDVGPQVDSPVTIADDDTWFGIDPDLVKTMRLGYNKNFHTNKNQCLWHANLINGVETDQSTWSINASGWWTSASGTAAAIVDEDGHLVGMTGTGTLAMELNGVSGDALTTITFPCLPRGGTMRIKFSTPDADHNPTFVRLKAGDVGSLDFGTPSEWEVEDGTGWYVFTQTYAPVADESNISIRGAYPLAIETDGVADIQWASVDEMVPTDWPHDTNPILYGRLKGYDFTLRHMVAQQVPGARDTKWSERARPTRLAPNIASVTHVANVVSVSPIAEDDDIVLKYFDHGFKSPIARIEVDSTAAFSGGHNFFFRNMSPASVPDTATVGSPPGATGAGNINLSDVFSLFVVEDETHFVALLNTTTSIPEVWSPYLTAAGTTTVSGQIYNPCGIGESHESIIRISNENDSDPWICLPHAADLDYAYQCGNLYGDPATGLDPGLDLILELGNEFWNNGMPFLIGKLWFRALLNEYESNYQLDNTKPRPRNQPAAAMQRSIELFTEFNRGFSDAGGDVSRVKWAYMGQMQGVGETCGAAVTYLLGDDRGADAGDVPVFTYWGGAPYLAEVADFPSLQTYDRPYTAAVLGDLDVDGLISLIGTHQLYGRMEVLTNSLLAILADLPYETRIAFYEYGYDHPALGAEDMARRNTEMMRHPRAWHLRTGRHQQFERYGVALAEQYVMDHTDGLPTNLWNTFDNIQTAVGTGDPSENANPWAVGRLSQIGGADRAWMTPAEVAASFARGAAMLMML